MWGHQMSHVLQSNWPVFFTEYHQGAERQSKCEEPSSLEPKETGQHDAKCDPELEPNKKENFFALL